jgi:hypothetical protein
VLPGHGGEYYSVQLAGSIVVPQLTQLLSVNALRAAGVGVFFPVGRNPYVALQSTGVRIPLRYGSDRLWYLDFLQPATAAACSLVTGSHVGTAMAAPSNIGTLDGLPVEDDVGLLKQGLSVDGGADGGHLATHSVPVEAEILGGQDVRDAEVPMGKCLWYRRFGHMSGKRLEATLPLVCGVPAKVPVPVFDRCRAMGRSAQKPRNVRKARRAAADVNLGQVSIDLHGPYKVKGVHGETCVAVFVDGCSRYTYAVPLVNASSACVKLAFRRFIRDVGKPKTVLTDWGSEFAGVFEEYCIDHDIQMSKSCPYEHWQAGLVERANRDLKETARVLLQDSQLPSCFWSYAVQTAAYLKNRSATKGLTGMTPYQAFYGARPDCSKLRLFGSVCFAHIEKQLRVNDVDTARKCIFVGYCTQSSSYLVYDPQSRRVYVRLSVTFDEDWAPALPVTGRIQNADAPLLSELPGGGVLDDMIPAVDRTAITDVDLDSTIALTGKQPQSAAISRRVQKVAGKTYRQVRNMSWVDNKGRTQKYSVSHFKYDLSQGIIATVPMLDSAATSASVCLSEVQQEYATGMLSVTGAEPRNRKEGLSWVDWPEWYAAELEEIAALERLGCWEYVPRASVPLGHRVYRNRMVYKQKPDRKKARLCFLGNTQRSTDYSEVYAPVVRLETVRMLCAKAALADWDVHLCDVQNAFVNSPLDRELYMESPEGHERPGMVCKLKKALYGCTGTTLLEQAL